MADRRGRHPAERATSTSADPRRWIIRPDGHGEIAFGAFQASLDLAYGYSDVSFDWAGFDEWTRSEAPGSAELLEDGSLEIEFDRHHGDEAILKADE